MEKIASFTINHLTHEPGIYLSRVDGDIYTYDIRFCKPYYHPLLTNAQLHSLEHIFATLLRNGEKKESVIYVGPMGCQTGFYVLYRGVELTEAKKDILSAFDKILSYDGEMPGNSEIECGYCHNLSLDNAKDAVRLFLERTQK